MNRGRGKKLRRPFYARPADEVAPDLLGKILVRRLEGRVYRARIAETEAYLGPLDLASHASKGRTARTEVMFGPAGRTYVYLIYGLHNMLNFVVGTEGEAHAVLLRAAVSMDDWRADLSGPGRLARAFQLTRQHNHLDLTEDELYVVDDPRYQPEVVRTRRIGIDYAGAWKDALLRFVDDKAMPAAVRRKVRPPGAVPSPDASRKQCHGDSFDRDDAKN